MLLTAIDPALLIYNTEDLKNGKLHCYSRLKAMTLHRQMNRDYGQQIAMSKTFASKILSSFPWNESGNNMLHDFRDFLFNDLTKAYFIKTEDCKTVNLQPKNAMCQHVGCPEVIGAWEQLLVGCASQVNLTQFDPQVASWENSAVVSHSTLAMNYSRADTGNLVYIFPLIRDENGWYTRLSRLDWWPNLHTSVKLSFKMNSALQSHPQVLGEPIQFQCADGFWDSVDQHCNDSQKRERFIKALTKMVYGVHDAGLGLEKIGHIRRFRVTRHLRVHCHMKEDRIIIDKIGPHRIDGVG